MSFSDDLNRFGLKVQTNSRAVFVNVASAAKDSITDGDPRTGSPGSPVDTGNLKNSWQLTFESPSIALISTNVEYAPYVEDNIRGVTFRVGGPHGVKLTAQNLDRIVEDETRKVAGNG